MKQFFLICLLATASLGQAVLAGDQPSNPLQRRGNDLLRYSEVKVEHIGALTESGLADLNARLERIYAASPRTFVTTLGAFDQAMAALGDVYGPIYLLANASTDEAIREACHQAVEKMQKAMINLDLDEKLYATVAAFAETDEALGMTGPRKRLLDRTLRDFRRNGLALPTEKREQLKKLRNELAPLEQEFDRNIAENDDALIMAEADMAGLGETYKQQRRQADGSYRIDLSYPSYREFMRDSTVPAKREALYKLYNNRAADKNLDLLKKVLILRKQQAELLGFDSYANLALSSKLAGNSERVLAFENGLIESLMPKAKQEHQRLLDAKRKREGADATGVYAWEYSFYNEAIMRDQYQVDERLVSEYFEMKTVLAGLFNITQTLMGVTFHKVENASVWHPDVTLYEVREGARKVGYFYLDLFPRANKYSHAACFPLASGRGTKDSYSLPVAALLCNFSQPTEGAPALMNQLEVETFFHEFGHVLHSVLTESELSSQAGTNVDGDFVEAPSQIFENWGRNYEALKLFARHYKTGEVMPKALFDRVLASSTAFTGIATLRQVFLGLLDMGYHHGYDPNGPISTDQVVQQVEARTTLYQPTPGTHFQAGFGHLMGYAANYYGYMYSEVFAYDMFSVFEKEGVLNPETGMRYRKQILAKGGTDDAMTLMRNFLGREPSNEAFARSLGIP